MSVTNPVVVKKKGYGNPNYLAVVFMSATPVKGLTIAVIATAVQGVVGLEGTAVGFATLAELLTVTLLRDSNSWSPRRLALRVTLGFGWGCTALTLCLEFLTLLLNHDLLYPLKVR